MALNSLGLPVSMAHELESKPQQNTWLIDQLWTEEAVGIIGGCPKCAKTWFGLELAISVASKSPCLGRFEVMQPGPSLIYLAEDSLSSIKSRIEALCLSHCIAIDKLDLHVITAQSLRLDIEEDQQRLEQTIQMLNPRLLVLDPLVRLHQLDENSSADISRLLGYLRILQRTHKMAIALVHHASKRTRANPGQSLRGSSDLHAWTDSAAYLSRKKDDILLHLEHRAAPSPDSLTLRLVCNELSTSLNIVDKSGSEILDPIARLEKSIVAFFNKTSQPIRRHKIRASLNVNNQRLGWALHSLETKGAIEKTAAGWLLCASE